MQWVMIGLGVVAIGIAIALVVMRSGSNNSSPSPSNQLSGKKPLPAASVSKKANWLEGTAGTIQGKTYHVGTRQVTIGRKVGNYIQIIDDDVSRVHVKISGKANGLEVIDDGSNSGTFVNDQKLVSGVPQLLSNGDRLRIGKNVFVYHAQGAFGTNHGLTDQKIAGDAQIKQTASFGAVNWKQEVADALVQAGGDKAKAAELMGVSVEIFEKMLDQAKN